MGLGVGITRLDRSCADLRREASRCKDSRAACRMLAIAHVLDGASRTEAARSCGMDRQTLRLNACVQRVHRYNAEGIAGLSNLPGTGRRAALTPEQMAELRALVLAGPDPAKDGVVPSGGYREAIPRSDVGNADSAAGSAPTEGRSRCADGSPRGAGAAPTCAG